MSSCSSTVLSTKPSTKSSNSAVTSTSSLIDPSASTNPAAPTSSSSNSSTVTPSASATSFALRGEDSGVFVSGLVSSVDCPLDIGAESIVSLLEISIEIFFQFGFLLFDEFSPSSALPIPSPETELLLTHTTPGCSLASIVPFPASVPDDCVSDSFIDLVGVNRPVRRKDVFIQAGFDDEGLLGIGIFRGEDLFNLVIHSGLEDELELDTLFIGDEEDLLTLEGGAPFAEDRAPETLLDSSLPGDSDIVRFGVSEDKLSCFFFS
mmetsp:Transcript_21316/g.32216  ORF Transcript_21316/g.32216 Transcript_21316/m.32216 type:complete len:264 (-) Transcript_21316:2081-2872(-)